MSGARQCDFVRPTNKLQWPTARKRSAAVSAVHCSALILIKAPWGLPR